MAAGMADGGSGRWIVLGGGRWWLQLWSVAAIAVFTLAAGKAAISCSSLLYLVTSSQCMISSLV